MKLLFSLLALLVLSTSVFADQGISDSEILVGMHTDISGPASMIGKQSVDGANMRFEEFNKKGGTINEFADIISHMLTLDFEKRYTVAGSGRWEEFK